MTQLHDIEDTLLSGYNHIDALLDSGPDWNYRGAGGNKIYYTFSITEGNEAGQTGQRAFNATQQAATRQIMEVVLRNLTGIEFVETTDGNAAEVHFCYQDLQGPNVAGQCSWGGSYNPGAAGEVLNYQPYSYIYLDDVEFGFMNRNLAPNTDGSQVLLHEIGHMLGLKHPHESMPDNPAVLPDAQDDSSTTLMSYERMTMHNVEYRPFDIAALNWIYGGDGLAGELGLNSRTGGRFVIASELDDMLTGGNGNDRLQGEYGNDTINGGAGDDTAVYPGRFDEYSVSTVEGRLLVTGGGSVDTLESIEWLAFTDMTLASEGLFDRSAPALSLTVQVNAAGYGSWQNLHISGYTEEAAFVTVYEGSKELGTSQAYSDGGWSVWLSEPLSHGSHTLTARATDSAGNVSEATAPVSFLIDAIVPAAPTAIYTLGGSGRNQLMASGTAEAGTMVRLSAYSGSAAAQAEQQVGPGGSWALTSMPLPNGSYDLAVRVADIGDNLSSGPQQVLTIASELNRHGGYGNDSLFGTSGNNAFDGSHGTDAVHYQGLRAEYAITQLTNEYGYVQFGTRVESKRDGLDGLYNVERIHFADVALAFDIGWTGGMAYRLYRAAFDRVPDKAGVGFWMRQLDNGTDIRDVAAGFIASAEFKDLYGTAPSNHDFVARLYKHVLHRPPDGDGFDYWVDALARGETRVQTLLYFSSSNENQAQVIAEIAQGFEFLPYA